MSNIILVDGAAYPASGSTTPVVLKTTTNSGVDTPSVIVDNASSITIGGVTVADGADAAQGTTTDAAVVTDANGTVSAKLRGLVKLLASVISSGKMLVTPDLPSGASTAAKQPALGTAGTASADVLSVQGVASMTPLDVNLKTLQYGALPVIKIGTTVTVAIGATSAASAAITATVVRLVSTSDCFIVFGAATPTATTAGLFLPANVPEYFQFTSGQEVAVIQSTAAGNLYVTAAA